MACQANSTAGYGDITATLLPHWLGAVKNNTAGFMVMATPLWQLARGRRRAPYRLQHVTDVQRLRAEPAEVCPGLVKGSLCPQLLQVL